MIETRRQLNEFLEYEGKLYGKKRPYIFLKRYSEKSISWRFQCLYRYEEYYYNSHKKIRYYFIKFLRTKMSREYNLDFSLNTIEKGLFMHHPHNIMCNAEHIGKNFSIQFGCSLVAGGHDGGRPSIGDNVIVGCCATLLGKIFIADGIAIGANSLVNKSFYNECVAIAGNPAKEISKNGSSTWGGTKVFNI